MSRPVPVGPYMVAHPLDITDRGEWEIRDRRGHALGLVDYYPRWRQHVFTAEPGAVLSHDCLDALAAFCRSVSGGQSATTGTSDAHRTASAPPSTATTPAPAPTASHAAGGSDTGATLAQTTQTPSRDGARMPQAGQGGGRSRSEKS